MSILCSTCYEGSDNGSLSRIKKVAKGIKHNLLQDNDCKPVTVKKIEDNFAKHDVNVNHDYVPVKHKRYATQMRRSF